VEARKFYPIEQKGYIALWRLAEWPETAAITM